MSFPRKRESSLKTKWIPAYAGMIKKLYRAGAENRIVQG